MGDYFFTAFLSTIVISRIVLIITKRGSPRIRGFRPHHYMYGLVFIAVAFFIQSLLLFSIGLALVLDEISFIFVYNNWRWSNARSEKMYLSKWSFADVLAIMLIVYILRNYLAALI